jgi:hypothetical protein
MLWLDEEAKSQQIQAMMQPAMIMPSTPGEVAGAAWDSFWSEDSLLSSDLMQNRAWEVVNERAGQKVWDLNSEELDGLEVKAGSRLLAADELAWQKLHQLRKANPALDLPETEADMMEIIRGLADETKARAEKVRAGATGWGLAAGYATTMGASVLDPLNLVTLPLGAGAGGLARIILTEAAIGAAVESVNQIGVSQWKQKLGRDYGAADIAESIAFASAGQGLLAGAFHGAGSLYRRWRYGGKGAPSADVSALPAVVDVLPEVQASAHAVGRDALAMEAVPQGVDHEAHRILLDAAERDLVAQETAELTRAYDEVGLNPEGVSEASIGSTGSRPTDAAMDITQNNSTLVQSSPPDFRPLPESLKVDKFKPVSLLGFIRKGSGIRDVTDDIKAMGGDRLVGVVRKKGMHPDDVALRAWEAGYFPEFSERPTINDLYDAIRAELAGNKRYHSDDLETVERQGVVAALREDVTDLLGSVDAARGMSDADLYDAMDIARVRRLWPEKDLPISDREALGLVDEAALYGRDLGDVIDEAVTARVAMSRSPTPPRLHPEYEDDIPFETTPWGDDPHADDSLWRDAQVAMLENPQVTVWNDLGEEINWNDAWKEIDEELAFSRDVAACMIGVAA